LWEGESGEERGEIPSVLVPLPPLPLNFNPLKDFQELESGRGRKKMHNEESLLYSLSTISSALEILVNLAVKPLEKSINSARSTDDSAGPGHNALATESLLRECSKRIHVAEAMIRDIENAFLSLPCMPTLQLLFKEEQVRITGLLDSLELSKALVQSVMMTGGTFLLSTNSQKSTAEERDRRADSKNSSKCGSGTMSGGKKGTGVSTGNFFIEFGDLPSKRGHLVPPPPLSPPIPRHSPSGSNLSGATIADNDRFSQFGENKEASSRTYVAETEKPIRPTDPFSELFEGGLKISPVVETAPHDFSSMAAIHNPIFQAQVEVVEKSTAPLALEVVEDDFSPFQTQGEGEKVEKSTAPLALEVVEDDFSPFQTQGEGEKVEKTSAPLALEVVEDDFSPFQAQVEAVEKSTAPLALEVVEDDFSPFRIDLGTFRLSEESTDVALPTLAVSKSEPPLSFSHETISLPACVATPFPSTLPLPLQLLGVRRAACTALKERALLAKAEAVREDNLEKALALKKIVSAVEKREALGDERFSNTKPRVFQGVKVDGREEEQPLPSTSFPTLSWLTPEEVERLIDCFLGGSEKGRPGVCAALISSIVSAHSSVLHSGSDGNPPVGNIVMSTTSLSKLTPATFALSVELILLRLCALVGALRRYFSVIMGVLEEGRQACDTASSLFHRAHVAQQRLPPPQGTAATATLKSTAFTALDRLASSQKVGEFMVSIATWAEFCAGVVQGCIPLLMPLGLSSIMEDPSHPLCLTLITPLNHSLRVSQRSLQSLLDVMKTVFPPTPPSIVGDFLRRSAAFAQQKAAAAVCVSASSSQVGHKAAAAIAVARDAAVMMEAFQHWCSGEEPKRDEEKGDTRDGGGSVCAESMLDEVEILSLYLQPGTPPPVFPPPSQQFHFLQHPLLREVS